jgi:hypothetical protein
MTKVSTMIGILVNTRLFKQVINGDATFENLSFYQHFSHQNQVPVCFYCMYGVRPNQPDLLGYVIDPISDAAFLQNILWPQYNYCRAVLSIQNRYFIEKTKAERGLHFFQLQSGEERNKWKHITLLRQNPALAKHLPDTVLLNGKNLSLMLQKHGEVVVKPVAGTNGKRITLIKKDGESYRVKSKELILMGVKDFSFDELVKFIERRYHRPHLFLVQERVRSDTFQDRIYDCRISVQKVETEEWKVTGKVIRLAQPGDFITNIHQGADALPFQALFTEEMPVARELNRLSVEIARELAKYIPVIDLGLDMMLDHNQQIWFIESNLRDQRLAYKAANDYDAWYRTTITPLSFILAKMKKEQPILS